MKKVCFWLVCWLYGITAQAQSVSPTWQEHIQPLMQQHCIHCHQKNGSAPFALTTYREVIQRAAMIAYVTQQKYMPPFPANVQYRNYANQNCLTGEQIALIEKWVRLNMPEGKKGKVKYRNAPVQNGKRRLPPPDITLGIHQPFTIPGNNTDRFERVLLPPATAKGADKELWVSGFTFFNTNKTVTHHTELMYCPPGQCMEFNNNPVGNGLSYESDAVSGNYSYLSGWLPGQDEQNGEFFPKGFAKHLPTGSGLLYLLHYAPSPVQQTDSAGIALFLSRQPNLRPVESIDLHGTQLFTKGKFIIPPDTVITLHATHFVETGFSVFSVMAHAHHLAKNMLAYAVTPQNDTIPLLKIDRWRFAWQFQYKLKQLLPLEKGTVIHFFVTFDNTAQNPENPNNPPRMVGYSFNANDEMMELFLLGSSYIKGDENYSLQW
ncbi:hypothetical protein C7N43_36935 [Sphingobacteriales bacterium UPWRP_1]|nr:hypothetical protein BVG80_11025 [Sphingobacteriales bacterium TSM_CSM]PSJ71902.1 hypothetical protein C7N43_36935 [Sphingobacteriales bacterium UPWRP_1]